MKKTVLFVFILTLMLLAACGNDKSDEASTQDTSESNQENNSITIQDSMGEVTLDGVPQKVVVLEWTYVEHMLPLGVEPTAVADVEGYNKWINVGEPLSDEVKDVGTRSEPNLEAISRMNPDLIIGAKYRHEKIASKLKDVAPTVLFSPYSKEGAADQYQHMLNEFDTVAKIFNKQEQSDNYVKELDQKFTDLGGQIKDAGYQDISAVVTQAFTSDNTPVLRLFTDNSLIGGVLEKLSVTSAVQVDEPEVYGFISATVETLQNYQDAHFFYLVQDDDNIFKNQLADNPAWTNLDFVEKNHTYRLPGDMGTFAGPLSAERFAEEFTAKLVENK